MASKSKSQQPTDRYQKAMDKLEEWVKAGRPDLLRQDLVRNQTDFDFNNKVRVDAMNRAMDVACHKGPEHMIGVAFEQMLRTCLWLQIRLESDVEPMISAWWSTVDEIRRLHEEGLPVVERLQHHILSIAKAYASVKHVLNLSERSDEQDFKERVLKLVKDAKASHQELTDAAVASNVA